MDGDQEDDGMMEQPPEDQGPAWDINQECRYIELLMGLMFDFEQYKEFEQECLTLETKREEYLQWNFKKDWQTHLPNMEEMGIPLHMKTQAIAKYWFDVGFYAGYTLILKDSPNSEETSPPQEE